MPTEKSIRTQTQIEDLNIRLVGIPGFGIFIPNFVGLFGNLNYQDWQYWLGYAYFILLAFLIWQGNRWLLFQQRKHYDWFRNPIRKLLNLLSANIFYTFPLTVICLWSWYQFADIGETNWQVITVCTLANVICVIFVTHAYETVFLIKEREDDQLLFEQIERVKIQAELEGLKNQIDPHFLFNSLNTLSYLIENEKEKALVFNEKLADVYRYILFNKDKSIITLTEELNFVQDYFTLLELRFGRGLRLSLPELDNQETFLIPPVSLQILIENAVKHNEFDENERLEIRICLGQDYIQMSNNFKPRKILKSSSKIGLKNLSERCKLIIGREISVSKNDKSFIVKIPLFKSDV